MHPRTESGASLIMVIIFVTCFGLVTGAIVDFLGVGFRVSNVIVEVRDEQQAVDGAMEGAINGIRGSLTAGHIGNPCPPFVYVPPAGSDDPTVRVSCVPEANRGGGLNDTSPEFAVLLLGDDQTNSDGDGCEGYAQRGNKTVNITGGIHSNSRINVGANSSSCDELDGGSNSRLNVDGDIFALGPCTPHPGGGPTATPKITATGDLDCDLAASRKQDDPNYPAAASGIGGMTIDPRATCTSAEGVVMFMPGVYTELPENHVPATCSNNANSVWWFSPGVYYFDFPEATSVWDLWPQDDLSQPEQRAKSIVGGTPHGWNASTRASDIVFFTADPTTGAVTDRACDPGTENSPNPGVQFILGGYSRLRTKSDNSANFRGDLEICAGDFAGDGTAQRIAVYGWKNGTRNPRPTAPKAAVGTLTADTFVNEEGARTPDDNDVAIAALSGAGPKTASIGFPAFGDTSSPVVPKGSIINSVSISVRHAEGGTDRDKVVPKLTVTYGAGGTESLTVDNRAAMTTDTYALDLTNLKTVFRYEDLNSLAVTFTADGAALTTSEVCSDPEDPATCTTTPDVATAELDGMTVEVDYTPPGFQAGRCRTIDPDCRLLETACGSSPACSTSSSENPLTVFEGMVYAPEAKMNLSIHNRGQTVFRRGLILRALDVDASASSTQPATVPPFQLPGVSNSRVVLFEATVDSKPRLRARVRYTDTDGSIDVPGYRVVVRRWTPLR
jgi:hypothetical protein